MELDNPDKEAGKAFLPLNLQHLLRLKTQKIPLSEKAGQIDADGKWPVQALWKWRHPKLPYRGSAQTE